MNSWNKGDWNWTYMKNRVFTIIKKDHKMAVSIKTAIILNSLSGREE